MIAAMFRGLSTLLMVGCLAAATAGRAQPARPADVGSWMIYGSGTTFSRDGQAPGKDAVTVAARAAAGEDWSSGAIMAFPGAVKAGERLSGVFWARASAPTKVPVAIQGPAPDYPVLAYTAVDLTPAWRRYIVGGVAAKDLAAGSQSLVVQLGKARAAVTLGPLLLVPGPIDEARIRRAFASFRPTQLVEDVKIASDPGVVLAGRLHVPAGHGPGPFPATILLVGSGPSALGAFPLIEQRLLAAGIATLDYDKRGNGRSTGMFVDTLEVVERDATAAVAYLRGRPDVARDRIGLLGLSQGGMVAPAVASRDPAIAAVVMLAGPVAAKGKFFFGQMERQLRAGGVSEAATGHILAATKSFLDASIADQTSGMRAADRQSLIEAFIAGGLTPEQAKGATETLDGPVARSAYLAAPYEALAGVRAPVLALYAGKDEIVFTPESLAAAKAALAHNPDATVIEIPGTNHAFQAVADASAAKPVYTGTIASAPGVADLIDKWLDVRLHRPARSARLSARR